MPLHDPGIFKFFQPIEIRYSDLGTREHVNNARYLNYLEDARLAYCKHLGMELSVGVIIVDIHITYHLPLFLDDRIKAGVKVAAIGNTSLTFQHVIVDQAEKKLFSSAGAVVVTLDYEQGKPVSVPAAWRKAVTDFEGG